MNELVEVSPEADWRRNDDDGGKDVVDGKSGASQKKKKIRRFYAAAAAGQAKACGAELVDFYTTASVKVSCWAS